MPGKMTTIVDDNLDAAAFSVPFNKVLDITRIQINNRANDDIRVRGWDTFTDTDDTEHTSVASPVPLFDYPVASLDAIVVDCADESKRLMGTLVLQAVSDSGTAIDSNVFVYVGGEYPF